MSSPVPCYPIFSEGVYDTVASTFPDTIDDLSGNAAMLAYLDHSDVTARFIDYLACPHWSYCYWFPPDVASGALQPQEWPLYGARANPSAYWLPEQTQYFSNPNLPSGETTLTRTDLISAPLMHGQLASFVSSAFGQQTSWWGVSRFHVQNRLPASSVTLTSASEGRWAFTGCSASFGTDITLTPTATTIQATYAAVGFADDPRLLIELADALTVGWSGDTIETAQVTLIGVDGATTQLATSPGTYSWRQASKEAKYAGSWAQPFGVGFDATDQGVDHDSGGISSTVDAGIATIFALQLLPTGTFQAIQFTFTLSDSSTPITLDFPSFTTRQDAPTILAETGQYQTALWANGPGIRFGQWTFWNPSGGGSWIGPTPNLIQLGHGWSVLDWLCTRRLALDGIAPDNGLDAEIAALYDPTEGQARANLAVGTNAFVIAADSDLSGVLVNSQAEPPPLACFPAHDRNSALQPLTTWSQTVWSHTQEPRYLINAGSTPADLFAPGPPAVDWTSPAGPTVSGWSLESHTHAVTNTEGPTFLVMSGGKTFAQVSPWHGYFCSLLTQPLHGWGYDVSNSLRHARTTINPSTGTFVLGVAGNVVPQIWTDSDSGIMASWARPRFADSGPNWPIGVFYGDGTNCFWARSYDEGATWGETIDMATGSIGDFEEGAGGLRWFYKLQSPDGGTTWNVWGRLLDAQLNVVRDWTETNVTGVDNAPIAVRESPADGGAWRIGLLYSTGGTPTVEFSYDGLMFS